MTAEVHRLVRIVVILLLAALPSVAAKLPGPLVDAAWLDANRGRADVLILDASPAKLYAAEHIPGAVSADVMTYGTPDTPRTEIESLFASWGLTPQKTVVVTDMGGSYLAARLFFALAYHGFPERQLALLDGGLTKWKADGLPVTAEVPAPAKGTFRIGTLKEELRVRLPEVLEASGDPERIALVEALGADWHYGQVAPFGRPGHIPNSILLPTPDLFAPDKTFKSAAELRTMLSYLGVTPEQRVYSYCGGGVAAAAPFFALKYLLDYPQVELFVESELGWLKDERQLPLWTYDAPDLMRGATWLATWGGKMIRTYTNAPISVVDVRPAEAFAEGHVPFALNVPAAIFRAALSNPVTLADALGAAGVNSSHEAVVVSGAGVTPEAALAFAMLNGFGQKKVSILVDSMEEAGEIGFVTKDATAMGSKKGSGDLSIVPTTYPLAIRDGVLACAAPLEEVAYPTVFIASGKALPASVPADTLVHVPYTDLLDGNGAPRPAKEIWSILSKAGVPRYARLVTIADDPGEAAANYYLLKLMGWPDVRVQLRNVATVAER